MKLHRITITSSTGKVNTRSNIDDDTLAAMLCGFYDAGVNDNATALTIEALREYANSGTMTRHKMGYTVLFEVMP